jgi:hypothetical protein
MTSDLASLLFGGVCDATENPSVKNVADVAADPDDLIIAWKLANLPDLPDAQNNCAACGIFIPVYDTGWVILGDKALIHYSGKHGKTCWDAWMSKRRKEAETNLGVTTL